MSAVEKGVDRRNDVLTIVDEKTYVVHVTGHYSTSSARSSEDMQFTLHMAEEEARALLAGLQEALTVPCDGSGTCPATTHIEGCFRS